jgi:hypothetical protein
VGTETGPKALWVADMLRAAGLGVSTTVGTVAAFVGAQPAPGFDGVAVSSVDSLEGRREVADVLARTTLSLGVRGLALHLQREHLGDGYACPYCEFVDVEPPLIQAAVWAAQLGLSAQRVAELIATGQGLSERDVECAAAARKIPAERAPALVGRRLADLVRQAYAEAKVPAPGAAAAMVSAPHVSWMGGVLAAAEVLKASAAMPMADRRVDLDLSGLPPGFVLKRLESQDGRCVCGSFIRRRWMKRLWGTTEARAA